MEVDLDNIYYIIMMMMTIMMMMMIIMMIKMIDEISRWTLALVI